MRKPCWAISALLTVALTLAACGQSAAPASAPAPAAAAPGSVGTPLRATAAPTASADWLNTATVDGDFYVLGNPGAPVRLTDYSDFL